VIVKKLVKNEERNDTLELLKSFRLRRREVKLGRRK
jgi:hypothetical protein